MRRRTVSLVSVILTFTATSAVAQWLNYPTPGIPRTPDGKPNLSAPTPKTADGKPDLTGIWTLTKTEGGLGQLKPSEIKPWALRVVKEREETLLRDSPEVHCLPTGPASPGLVKIVQAPALILMLREDLTYRQIFLDGRDLPKDPNPAWMGYSVGGWDGDALVVKSAGYNDRTWLDAGGHPHTESLQITERFHRGDFGHLTVDVVYSDPEAYEKPGTAKIQMQYAADTDLLEYVCGENEKDGIHLVGRKSDLTKNAVKLAPEVLGKYVGTYEREALRGVPPVEYRIELDDDGLTLNTPGSQKTPLTALSENIFITSFGLRFEFDKGDKGNATYFIIIAAQGDLRADRKK